MGIIEAKNEVLGFLYRTFLKPVFFLIDPERVHEGMVRFGAFLGSCAFFRWITRCVFGSSHNSMLRQSVRGVVFENPIGLSGGFDKNAVLTGIMGSVGFGFMEVGSVTARAYAGNPGRHLWRMPASRALVVYYGLKNEGAAPISNRLERQLARRPFDIPVSINIAKTNCRETNDVNIGIADYCETFKMFLDIGSMFTINISCPNVTSGQPFHEAENLEKLLKELGRIPTEKPIFIKISPDVTHEQLDAILEVAAVHHVDGFVCTNLSKRRDLSSISPKDFVPEVGGISGKVVEELTNAQIPYVYRKSKGRFLIIGVGGIFSAQDAYRKIRLGASLLELITGMVYQGPQLISEIQLGLIDLLKKDGFTHISQAVGIDA